MEGDLISTKVSAAPGVSIPAQLQELQTLLKDPSPTAASNLASSLHFKYGGLAHWPLRLFDGCVEALRNLNATFPPDVGMNDTMSGGGHSLSTASMEIVRASRLYAELLAETAEHAGSGCMNEVVLSWLGYHDLDWMKSVLGQGQGPVRRGEKVYEDHPTWFLSFMVQLVIQGFCSIEILVQDLCGAMLSKVAGSVQQQQQQQPSTMMDSQSDHLEDLQHQLPEESMLRLCMTMVILLRMLLLEDAFSNPRGSHAYGASHHGLSLEHHADRFGIQLSMAEIHALQTQRYSRLVAVQPQTRHEQNAASIENGMSSSSTTSSLEHRMMLVQFQICRDLVWIESCLPLSHKVLHEIQEYRKDWSLSADWLREKCLANVDEAYKLFLQTRQEEPTTEATEDRMAVDSKSTTASTTHSSGQGNKKHVDIVERKMMETFQMLMAESHESSLMLMDNYDEAALTPSMIHQRTFRSIFSRVDRWIFDRCKVEFWLLLDNVMMERSGRDKRAAGGTKNGHGPGSTESSSTDGMMMMEGVTMASGPGASSEPTNSMGMSDSGIDMSGNGADGGGDSLQQLIHVFYHEFVLTEGADKELLGRMITGMRSDAVEEVK